MPGHLIGRGWSVNRARKTVIIVGMVMMNVGAIGAALLPLLATITLFTLGGPIRRISFENTWISYA
jgi:hypothetical protein